MMVLVCIWLVIITVSSTLCTSEAGDTFTSGFPSLEEIRGNGSLLNDGVYSTHDGEERSVPGVNFTCNGKITKLTFIALPGVGIMNSVFTVIRSDGFVHGFIGTSGANLSFGNFGYEISSLSYDVQNGDTLQIKHQPYEISRLRILHQRGDKELEICWKFWEVDTNDSCELYYDYPLMAVETDSPNCVKGSLNATELRSMWENRTRPVLYSSPERDIPLDCSGPGTLSEILVGAYITGTGDMRPRIMINGTDICDLSTLHATEHLNVYNCTPVTRVKIDVGSTLQIAQRNATSLISFLHDGEVDTPLMFLNISAECSASKFMSEKDLKEKAALHIPNFAIGNNGLFEHLNITQDGYLTKWIFTAEDLGEGEERTKYPKLRIIRMKNGNAVTVSTLEGCDAVLTSYFNVYEHTIKIATKVQAGDSIEIVVPSISDARLLLSFVRNSGPPGINVRKRDVKPVSGREGNLPLVTLEISPLTTTNIPPSSLAPTSVSHILTPTPSPSTEPSSLPTTSTAVIIPATSTDTVSTSSLPTEPSPPTNDDPNREKSGSNTGAVVGTVLALLLAAALVIILVLVLLFVLRKRRVDSVKRNGIDTSLTIPMDNPVYSGCDLEDDARQLEEPEYQDPSPPIVSTTTAPDSSSTQIYSTPDEVHKTDKKEVSQSFDNPGYYSTLQEVHSTADKNKSSTNTTMLTSNHYETGIYVPTQEQRRFVENCASGTNNIYATLEETQDNKEGQTVSFFEECERYWRPASTKEDLYQQLAQRKYREIPRHQIQITEHLGSGQFGKVNQGVWQGGSPAVQVAVKMLQEGTSEEDTVRFLQEAAIMGQFRHPNIVELLGVVTVGNPVMIVLELVNNGDLHNYLLQHKPVPGELPMSDTAGLLSQFCMQVARGMDYLSSKAFVHRDLAARNILVTEHKTCKISDFGMSRDLEEGTYYVSQGGKIPVKWTAPEALHYKKYSTASDVWSFGCLMYEIWSLGHKPFEGYTNPDTIKLIDNGRRLAPPPGCPQAMYRVMIACWNSDKSARPQFREIVKTLSQPEHELLHIPEEVSRGHPQASVLGAPLEAGSNLYTELQNTYMHD